MCLVSMRYVLTILSIEMSLLIISNPLVGSSVPSSGGGISGRLAMGIPTILPNGSNSGSNSTIIPIMYTELLCLSISVEFRIGNRFDEKTIPELIIDKSIYINLEFNWS